MQNQASMTPDTLLNGLLADWHRWMAASPINGTDRMDDPTFRDVKSGRCWDSADDIIEAELKSDTMKTIDFCVAGDARGQGAMAEPYRAAIYTVARNQSTGSNTWSSSRLPADPMERGVIVMEAKNMLTRRLMTAGVMF